MPRVKKSSRCCAPARCGRSTPRARSNRSHSASTSCRRSASRATSGSRTSGSPTRRASGCCAASPFRSRHALRLPSWARPGRARPRSSTSSAGCIRGRRGASPSMALTFGNPLCRAAQQHGGGHAGDVPLLAERGGEPHARRAVRSGAVERCGANRSSGAAPRQARRRPRSHGHGARRFAIGRQAAALRLCRALYADPAILALDEATSNIDSATEILIQDALRNLLRNRTSIVVAHRLSTVRTADNIVVIDKGTVAEQGRHEELLNKKGLYFELYKLQFDKI